MVDVDSSDEPPEVLTALPLSRLEEVSSGFPTSLQWGKCQVSLVGLQYWARIMEVRVCEEGEGGGGGGGLQDNSQHTPFTTFMLLVAKLVYRK